MTPEEVDALPESGGFDSVVVPVVDAAWDELMADAIWDEADAIPTGFGLASTKTPPGFGNGTIRFPTIIKRTLT